MTNKEALTKAMKLCSSQEYAIAEIRHKLTFWGVQDQDEIIQQLIHEKFLDDYRMAGSYVRDKFRLNQWGKIKIRYMLEQKGVAKEAITQALNELNPDIYRSALLNLLKKKRNTLHDTDHYSLRAKLIQYANNRGFEDQAYKLLNDILD